MLQTEKKKKKANFMENKQNLYLSNTTFSQAVKNDFYDTIAAAVVTESLIWFLIKISMLTDNFFML